MIPFDAMTLGLLAGGRGRRMGGCDKAWLPLRGSTLLEQALAAMPPLFATRLVSTSSEDPRFTALSLRAVPDLRPDFAGPVAGLEALARACPTFWLVTLPVDVDGVPPDLLDGLWRARSAHGSVLVDATGLQPLLGLWNAAALAAAATAALDAGERAAHRLVDSLDLGRFDIAPEQVLPLNTPEDLQAASLP